MSCIFTLSCKDVKELVASHLVKVMSGYMSSREWRLHATGTFLVYILSGIMLYSCSTRERNGKVTFHTHL